MSIHSWYVATKTGLLKKYLQTIFQRLQSSTVLNTSSNTSSVDVSMLSCQAVCGLPQILVLLFLAWYLWGYDNFFLQGSENII